MGKPNKTVARVRAKKFTKEFVTVRSFRNYGECVTFQEEMKEQGYTVRETRQKDGSRKVFVYKKVGE